MSENFSDLVPMLDAFTALSYSEQNDVLLGKRSIVIPKPELNIIEQSDNKPTVTYNFTKTSDVLETDKIKELQVQVKELQDVLNNILKDKLR